MLVRRIRRRGRDVARLETGSPPVAVFFRCSREGDADPSRPRRRSDSANPSRHGRSPAENAAPTRLENPSLKGLRAPPVPPRPPRGGLDVRALPLRAVARRGAARRGRFSSATAASRRASPEGRKFEPARRWRPAPTLQRVYVVRGATRSPRRSLRPAACTSRPPGRPHAFVLDVESEVPRAPATGRCLNLGRASDHECTVLRAARPGDDQRKPVASNLRRAFGIVRANEAHRRRRSSRLASCGGRPRRRRLTPSHRSRGSPYVDSDDRHGAALRGFRARQLAFVGAAAPARAFVKEARGPTRAAFGHALRVSFPRLWATFFSPPTTTSLAGASPSPAAPATAPTVART